MPPVPSPLPGVAIIPIPPGFKVGNWNRDGPSQHRDQCQRLGLSEFPVSFSAGGISNRECHNILSIPAALYSYWCDSSQVTLTSLVKASFTQFQFLPMALTVLSVPLPNMPLSLRPSPIHNLSQSFNGGSLLPRSHCPLCTHKSILFCTPKYFFAHSSYHC